MLMPLTNRLKREREIWFSSLFIWMGLSLKLILPFSSFINNLQSKQLRQFQSSRIKLSSLTATSPSLPRDHRCLMWEVWTFSHFLSYSIARNPFQGWKLFKKEHTTYIPAGRHCSLQQVCHLSYPQSKSQWKVQYNPYLKSPLIE